MGCIAAWWRARVETREWRWWSLVGTRCGSCGGERGGRCFVRLSNKLHCQHSLRPSETVRSLNTTGTNHRLDSPKRLYPMYVSRSQSGGEIHRFQHRVNIIPRRVNEPDILLFLVGSFSGYDGCVACLAIRIADDRREGPVKRQLCAST